MAEFGIGAKPNEIEAWNDPTRWVQSELQTAIARGDMGRAKALNDNLATRMGVSETGIKTQGQIESTKLGIKPAMEAIDLSKKIVPNATDILADKEKETAKRIADNKAIWEKFQQSMIK